MLDIVFTISNSIIVRRKGSSLSIYSYIHHINVLTRTKINIRFIFDASRKYYAWFLNSADM